MWSDLDDNAEKWLREHKKLIQFCIIVILVAVMCIGVYTFMTRTEVIMNTPCEVCWGRLNLGGLMQ